MSCFYNSRSNTNDIYWESKKKELADLISMNTFSVVPIPPGIKPIPTRFVNSKPIKKINNKYVQILKSRLVALGFLQRYGINFFETYSPTASYTSFRLLTAHAAMQGLTIKHLDFRRAYLNGKLNERVYVFPPVEFKNLYPPGTCWLLNKSLDGLKQSGRVWNQTIHSTLLSMGFEQCFYDKCVYICKMSDEVVRIVLYVDDIFISYKNEHNFLTIKQKLEGKYVIKDLGEIKKTLGMEVVRTDVSFILHQHSYAISVLEQFGFSDVKPSILPTYKEIPHNLRNEYIAKLTKFSVSELVGSLLWLSRLTRPDISFAVANLSQYTADTTMTPYVLAYRILRYIRGTTDYGIEFSAGDLTNLRAYVDADFGSCVKDRKSQSGFIFFLTGGPISWLSKKQSVVALSTTESEIYALSKAIQEAMYLMNAFHDLQIKFSTPISILEDNSQTITRAKTSINSKFLKHIDIRHKFINEKVSDELVSVDKVDTKNNTADVFTKPLNKNLFYRHISKFMVVIPQEYLDVSSS